MRTAPYGLDVHYEVELNGTVVSRPEYRDLYWSPAQMLAHLTVNGASLRPGDLFGSGTISGAAKQTRGSLLELSWNGAEPIALEDGTTPVVPRGRRPGHPARVGARSLRSAGSGSAR